MAARADVLQVATGDTWRVHDSTKVPPHEWDDLMAEARAKRVELICPNCLGRLGGRRSHKGTQHFYHWPNESLDCVNRSHEGESDQHRETADLLALDVETIGGRAEREWRFQGGVADVAVWPSKRPASAPSSIVELERKADTTYEYLHRDSTRYGALAQDAAGNFGRGAVLWVAHNQHAATYLRLPQLYLKGDDVSQVNDGAFYQVDGDMADPAVLDRTEALAMVMDGRMVRVEGAIYRGDGEHGDAWIIRPGVKAGERGRRRRQAPPREFIPHAEECQREPVVVQQPLLLMDRQRGHAEREASPVVDLRKWRPCARCGRPMCAGQRITHHSCEVPA